MHAVSGDVYLCGERDRGQADDATGDPALLVTGKSVTGLGCGDAHYVVSTNDGVA